MSGLSVVVPVLDGERYLAELLAALRREAVDEVLVIDSGSRDGSVALARAAGVQVVQIAPEEFGHGRTRNLGAERTAGELVAFLTQDATPQAGWASALREGFALDERVGAVYGPHRPRPDTSPMIARELTDFFAGFSPTGEPVLQRHGDDAFLSNVNAAYRRACWAELRFPDVPYAEDQAFGRAMLERGWLKVYHPGAAVLHAHDYGPLDFMRRYFDEYRGLRVATGHVEPFGVRAAARDVRALVSADRAWMVACGLDPGQRRRWTARAAVHHAGRKVFSALGSRPERLPAALQRAISLEGRAVPAAAVTATPPPSGAPVGRAVIESVRPHPYASVAAFHRDGPAPLLEAVPGMAERPRLHVAVVIPNFRRGSGGHASIFQLVAGLERMGHTCSIWLHDPFLYQRQPGAVLRRQIVEDFGSVAAPVFQGLDEWFGADVAVATGWQTVYPVLGLDHCRARAYLVHDHENEFSATSVESYWAEQTYRLGLHHIAASPWLRGLIEQRYGGSADEFEFGVDHDTYWPRPVERRRDTIVFYARTVTPRRAVPLGALALQELRRRRPELRVVLFGAEQPEHHPFPYEYLGVVSPEELAWVYSEATIGLCLSMTNYSLIPQEMLACGLPCVDLAGFSSESVFGEDGPVELAPFDPIGLADAMERLLDDQERWEHRAEAGREFVAEHTWAAAARQVEAGLRRALELREVEAGLRAPA